MIRRKLRTITGLVSFSFLTLGFQNCGGDLNAAALQAPAVQSESLASTVSSAAQSGCQVSSSPTVRLSGINTGGIAVNFGALYIGISVATPTVTSSTSSSSFSCSNYSYSTAIYIDNVYYGSGPFLLLNTLGLVEGLHRIQATVSGNYGDSGGTTEYFLVRNNWVNPLIFDLTYYAQNNPDVAAQAGGNQGAILQHWFSFGINEGRQASATFNSMAYLDANADVLAGFGRSPSSAIDHFLSYGYREGRIATYERLTSVRQAQQTDFLNRLYVNVLGRNADEAGRAFWLNAAQAGSVTCSSLAVSFLNSGEFQAYNANIDDTTYVTGLYNVLLGRGPDQTGLANWTQMLASRSANRQGVADGFLNSSEFDGLCKINYGFPAGRGAYAGLQIATPLSSTVNAQITNYVTSLYNNVLGRGPDQGGLDYWLNAAKSGSSCSQIAVGFLNSPEFRNRNSSVSNETYVTGLYNTLLGRAPDADGLNYWAQSLANGSSTRQSVADGFLRSAEFNNLCQGTYGFPGGTGTFSDLAIPNP